MRKPLLIAREEHEKFLRKMGVHPEQLHANKKAREEKLLQEKIARAKERRRTRIVASNVTKVDTKKFEGFAAKKSIFDVLPNEKKEVAEEILRKARRVGLPYSKGAYQYLTDGTDPTEVGRKK